MIHKPIFTVHVRTRLKEENKNYYVFVGPQNDEVMDILRRLGLESKMKKPHEKIIRDIFGNLLDTWFDWIKKRNKIHFIPNFIKMDDSLNEVKKKIFVYCSHKDNYILPQNQEIWIKIGNSEKYRTLGYHYINKQTGERYIYPPHVYTTKIEIDEDLLPIHQRNNQLNKVKEYKVDTAENYLLLHDLLQNENIHDNVFYVSDAMDEIRILKEKGKIMNEKRNKSAFSRILNGYLRKYWIHIQPDFDKNEAKSLFDIAKFDIERDEYIQQLLTQNIVNASYFEPCAIKTVKININSKSVYDEDEDEQENIQNENENTNSFIQNEKEMDFVDLYQIFDYVREKRMGIDLPYIKYGDITIDEPFVVISLQAIREKKLRKNLLFEWLGLTKTDERRISGLQVKRFIKMYGEDVKYSTIQISRNGKISINISYKHENNATIHDIELAIKNCKKFIDDLNSHIPDYRLIRSIPENKRIESPDMTVHEDGNVDFKRNTKLTFLNMSIAMNLPKQINFEKLKEFSKKFPNYLAQEPISKKNVPNIIKNSLHIRYNRVSSFANMNDIMMDIDKMKEKKVQDSFILSLIMKKYQKTMDEAKEYLKQWIMKFSALGTGKIDSKFKTGVRVQIFQNKIIFDGITNIYQVPELYQFFTFFIYLFLHSEKYSSQKLFQQYFLSSQNQTMNLVKNELELQVDSNFLSQYNQNQYLQEIEGLSSSMIHNEFVNIQNKKSFLNMMNHNNNEDFDLNKGNNDKHISQRGTLLANEDDIDINIRLDCGNDKEVEEVQTCEDFCNDSHYFIRRLQLYDNVLFKYNVLKKKGEVQYSRSCQSKAQPIILDYDPVQNPRIKRESYSYTFQYSSDPQLNPRWYICPKIWCPYCEIPIAEQDIDRKTISKKLMTEGKKFCVTCQCPYGDHQAFIRDDNIMTYDEEKHFRNELKQLKTDKEREMRIAERQKKNPYYAYPGFAPKLHPKGFCLPCCFERPHNIKDSKKFETFQRCLGEEVDEENKSNGSIYIKKSIPVNRGRFGILPIHPARILNTITETGTLGIKSGYFRKGIRQNEIDSFLTAVSDIISCEKTNNPMTTDKLKQILLEKLTEPLFRSLHNGNLYHIFNDPTKNISSFENFKLYLQQQEQEIQYQYLWDLLQRPHILYNEGVNIFIFDDNQLVCPKGENINEFYQPSRKNILLIKHKQYTEPIYYLDGDGKGAKMKCLFDSTRPEIKKLHEIAQNGCNEKSLIRWNDVLQNSIQQYQLNISQIELGYGESLMHTLEKILIAIQEHSLKNTYMPIKQYVDSYNKVFAIGLKNGLFLPVKPSKLYTELPYQELIEMDSISYLNFETTKKYTDEIHEKAHLSCKITEKVIDHSETKNKGKIIAVILENDRIIPIVPSSNTDRKIRESSRKYYSNIDYYLQKQVDYLPDERILKVNKKNYEDESYQRFRFEISRYLQLKNMKSVKQQIEQILHEDSNSLQVKRKKLFQLLQEFIRDIVIFGDKDIDYHYYQKPNKRVPCFLRAMKSNTKETNNTFTLSCEDDPHCIVSHGKCKLFIHRRNLLNPSRDNEMFYLDRITEELLRYPLKRNEILFDNIPSIIDKEKVYVDPTKYVFIHGENDNEIIHILDNLYMDRSGIFLNTKPLYEEFTTQNYTFMKNMYMKTSQIVNETLFDAIPPVWEPYFSPTFKIQKNIENSLFISLSYALRELTQNSNYSSLNIQMKIGETLQAIQNDKSILRKIDFIFHPPQKNKNKNQNMNSINENVILQLYKNQCSKLFNQTQSFDALLQDITNPKYTGCEMDIVITSLMMNVNILILEKMKPKEAPRFSCVGPQFHADNSKHILLYKTTLPDKNVYFILQNKGKYVFEDIDLPFEFKNKILEHCESHQHICYDC